MNKADAPEEFPLSGQGNGGGADYAKGGAEVTVLEKGDTTISRYTAKAEIGGKLAQLASSQIQGTKKKTYCEIFQIFRGSHADRNGVT